MAGAKDVRTLCQSIRPVRVKDGTLCRCESPLPGSVDAEPWSYQHFGVGVPDDNLLGQEGWFENRYPNLLETSRVSFTSVIDDYIQKNWGKPFEDQGQRIVVVGRNFYLDAGNEQKKKNVQMMMDKGWVADNLFEQCGRVTADGIPLAGDTPQTHVEADQLVGRFWIDIETPITITYSTKKVQGQVLRTFKWSAVMYVGDVLGAQKGDSINWVNQIPLVGPLAPSRHIKRARWTIHGEGVSDVDLAAANADQSAPVKTKAIRTHIISPGDTLSKLAEKYYGDAKWYPILYLGNQQIIGSDADKLRVGDTLRIPNLEDLTQEQKDRALKPASKPDDHAITIPPLR